MPQKPITWIGSLLIVAAGGFCWWALTRLRDNIDIADGRFTLVTIGTWAAPVVALLAISLWYFVNERR